jgi:hypothetical protein
LPALLIFSAALSMTADSEMGLPPDLVKSINDVQAMNLSKEMEDKFIGRLMDKFFGSNEKESNEKEDKKKGDKSTIRKDNRAGAEKDAQAVDDLDEDDEELTGKKKLSRKRPKWSLVSEHVSKEDAIAAINQMGSYAYTWGGKGAGVYRCTEV